MQSLANDPAWARFSIHGLVVRVGTQGIGLLVWLAVRGTLSGPRA